ncbi:MAG: ATP-dependent transcriptional regulator, MalT-like, LuxR family [Flavipsychrobacter sp.]|jgi:DNA-binding CsgD family transcriptional regulator|nr:ATP-dependent transcriptional regulator, MalT-like, LuxR family [Flavipsychrobacter sp.]
MAITRPVKFTARHKHGLIYAVSLATVLFVLKWLEFRFVIIDHALEFYTICIALLFTLVGIWLALKLARPKVKTVITAENTVRAVAPELSRREMDVLEALAKGLSNKEMAAALFVSENTVKTHLSNLFVKLGANRRTQAIDKAKKLGLLSSSSEQVKNDTLAKNHPKV